MANIAFKGIDVRQTGTALVFRASLKDSTGAKLATGTTNLAILELQSDGTFKTYDFSSNTFKTSGMTTSNSVAAMTHRTRITDADASVNLGIWTYALATLTGFTVGAIYIAQVSNSGASPVDQEREFQYGSAEGDLKTTANGTGVAELNSDVQFFGGNAGTFSGGRPEVNATHLAGTAFGSVTFPANLTQIKGTTLTESSAGYLAAAFIKQYDVATPVFTAASVNQGGDAFTRIGALGAGLTLLATSANQTTILNAVNAITTSTARSAPRVPDFMPRPSAGSSVYVADLYLYSLQGQLEDADAAPTVHARNSAGTSRDSGLTSTTMTRIGLGHYRFTYTVNSSDTAEAVYFDFTWAIATVANADGAATEVQDAENYAALVAIQSSLTTLNTNIPQTVDAAFVRGSVGLSAANLDTQLDNIPTVTEMNARTLASASYALGTDISTLSTLVTNRTVVAANYALTTDVSTLSTLVTNRTLASGSYLQTADLSGLLTTTHFDSSLGGLLTTTHFDSSIGTLTTHGDDNWAGGSGGDTTVIEIIAPIGAVFDSRWILSSGNTQCFQYVKSPTGPIAVMTGTPLAPFDLRNYDLKIIIIDDESLTLVDVLTSETDGGLTLGGTGHNEIDIDWTPEVANKLKRTTYVKLKTDSDWQKGIVVEFGYYIVEAGYNPAAV